jgi:predicted  nucleic acid-binding Zn-ribbon protein
MAMSTIMIRVPKLNIELYIQTESDKWYRVNDEITELEKAKASIEQKISDARLTLSHLEYGLQLLRSIATDTEDE